MRRRNRVPGCIFLNNGRYWWRIKLPGETKKKARPLIPDGGAFATDDPGVAEQVARDMYARAVFAARLQQRELAGHFLLLAMPLRSQA